MSEDKEKILIIGAGLCGSLLAIQLAQKGYKVKVIESREDLRKNEMVAGRSINLALSNRGIKALASVGLEDKIQSLCIPMKGRMIHDTEGNTFLSPYSGRETDFINSISRRDLNALLLDEAEKYPEIKIDFQQACEEVNYEKRYAVVRNKDTEVEYKIEAELIFGTDGAGSVLRKSYQNRPPLLFSHSIDFLSHGYKELTLPAGPNNSFQIDKNALHIWPRGTYMLIALPNIDGSFTVTLFLPHSQGKYNFESLENAENLVSFFKEQFPDVHALMPDLVEEYYQHPIGNLGTVKCHPWNFEDHSLLMGDAAHAVVPFYGQGMNASFEDVVVLNETMKKYPNDWKKTLDEFSAQRKVDSDAIADLAIDNFYEMRDHVANPYFKEKRQIEMQFEKEFPTTYYSKYSLVTFREDISYHQAMDKGRLQDKVLLELIYTKQINAQMPVKEMFSIFQNALQKEKDNFQIKQVLD